MDENGADIGAPGTKSPEKKNGKKEKSGSLFYGWIVCGVLTLLLFITVGTASNALSVFMPYIKSGYDLTNAQTSSLVTMRCTASFIGMLLVEKFYGKVGFRKGTALAAFLCAVAYVIYAIAWTYRIFLVGAFIAGMSYGLGSMVPVAIIMNRWFVKHRALVLGICSAGSGAAIIVLPPILTGVVIRTSLKIGFIFTACYVIIAAFVIYTFVRERPQDKGLDPLGWKEVLEKPHEHLPEKGAEPHESKMLSKRDWVLMGAVVAVMGAVANPGFVHLSMLFTGEGYRPMTVAAILSVVGIVMTVFKVLFGEATDILGGRKATAIFFIVLITGYILCCFSYTQSVPVAMVTAVVIGIGYPISAIGIPVWAADLVSSEHYGELVWKLQLIYAAGAMIFAGLPGMIADRTGGYIPVYAMFAVMTIITLVCVMAAYHDVKVVKRRRRMIAAIMDDLRSGRE
ncbi:MAG: MFS transporter [Firmicutes bacterium]|nr:MFS transporter [Bacillota bacterium]